MNLQIPSPLRIQGNFPRTADIGRHDGGKSHIGFGGQALHFQQLLVAPPVAFRYTGILKRLRGGHRPGFAEHPDRTATYEMRAIWPYVLVQGPRIRSDDVDDHIGAPPVHLLDPCRGTARILCLNSFHRLPFVIIPGYGVSPGHDADVVSFPNQHRRQESADMSGSANAQYFHRRHPILEPVHKGHCTTTATSPVVASQVQTGTFRSCIVARIWLSWPGAAERIATRPKMPPAEESHVDSKRRRTDPTAVWR